MHMKCVGIFHKEADAHQAEWCIQCSCVCVCRCVTVCGQWTYSPIICMSVDFCCVDCDCIVIGYDSTRLCHVICYVKA